MIMKDYKTDEGLQGNEKIEEAIAGLQHEATQEMLAPTLNVIRRRMKEDGQFIIAVEPPKGDGQIRLEAIRTEDGKNWWSAFTSFEEELKGVHSIGIAGHIRPDGDAVGSCLGMYLYLSENYPELAVQVYLEDFPKSFMMLKGTETISHEESGLIVHDVGCKSECGACLTWRSVDIQDVQKIGCELASSREDV